MLPLAEIFVAIWLVFRVDRVVLLTALGLFSFYVGYLVQLLGKGRAYCKCLGSGYTDVNLVIGLDLLAISCLVCHREFIPMIRRPSYVVAFASVIPLSCLLWSINPTFQTMVAVAMNPGPLRTEFKSQFDLPATSAHKCSVIISNRTRKAIEIDEFMISCGCTQFSPQRMTLPPGGSDELQLSIDLNKSFKEASESKARLIVSAGCYDRELNEVDQISIFASTVSRTFAPLSNSITHHFDCNSVVDQVSIPIKWLSRNVRPLEVRVDGRFVSSESASGIVRFAIDRPRQSFTSLAVSLTDFASPSKVETTVELKVIAIPTKVIARDFKSPIEGADSKRDQPLIVRGGYRDSAGKMEGEFWLNATKSHEDGIELSLNEVALSGSGEVVLYLEHEDGFLHTLVIPQYSFEKTP